MIIKKYFKSFDLCVGKDNNYFVKLYYNFGDGTVGYDYITISKEDFDKFSDLESVWYKEKKENEK